MNNGEQNIITVIMEHFSKYHTARAATHSVANRFNRIPNCKVKLDHSPPSSAEVKNEQELYLLSPHAPPWRVTGSLYRKVDTDTPLKHTFI
jgi:hypothetical protein